MKKFTTKIAAISMATMMALSMSACSINITTEKAEDTQAQVQETVENPIKEVSQEEMVQATGIDLPLPAEATDATYSIIDMEDNDIAQVDFTLDGEKMYLRACFTNETALVERSEDIMNLKNSAGDISGLNYEWNASAVKEIQGREAVACVTKKGQGYIAWLDVVPGILYNLCMEEKAEIDKFEALATTVFVPMQGEVEADADVEEVPEGTDEYAALMDEIYNTRAGSAGSSERVVAASEKLGEYVVNNADAINYQSQSALAADMLSNLKAEYGEDCVGNFDECFNAVVEQAMSQNSDLETDVAFNDVVNAVMDAIGAAE